MQKSQLVGSAVFFVRQEQKARQNPICKPNEREINELNLKGDKEWKITCSAQMKLISKRLRTITYLLVLILV